LRSPAEYYLKYLIISRFADVRINQLMDRLGYPRLRAQYLAALRRGIKAPKPLRIGLKHKRTDTWLEKQSLYPLFYRDKHMDKATMALSNNTVRPLLESLILSDTPTQEIVGMVKTRTGAKYPEQVIRYYKHFFWNRDLLTAQEWDEFLENYTRGAELRGVYGEGAQMVKWRLGFNGAIDANDMLRSVQTEAFHRFMQTHNMSNSTSTAKIAATWAGVLFEAGKQLNSGETQLSEVISQFEAIFVRRAEGTVDSIQELAGDSFSQRSKRLQAPPEVVDIDNMSVRLEESVDED